MLQLRELHVGYAGTRGAILTNIDCEAHPGQLICVLGRNGAGKSTLLRTIAGLQLPLAGKVRLGDADVATWSSVERARAISVVITERAAPSGLTSYDVVALGRAPYTNWTGELAAADESRVRDALQFAGAMNLAQRAFDTLSDGERQRVTIARALAQDPRLLVLDEITSFLDLPGRVAIMTALRRHARASQTIVVLSSHDLELSLQLADCVWLVDGSSGLIVGSPQALIAAGAINAAFDTAEVSFDRQAGRFGLADRGR